MQILCLDLVLERYLSFCFRFLKQIGGGGGGGGVFSNSSEM